MTAVARPGVLTPASAMLSTRIATALVLIPLVLAALFGLPPTGWALAALVAIGAAAFEWARLAGCDARASAAFVAVTVAFGAACVLLPAAGFGARGWPSVVLVALCAPALGFWLLVAPGWLRASARPASKLALCAVGLVALIGAWAAVVQMQARSPWLVLAALAVVWIADTAAYFAGRALGRHKLAPAISPGKTWEGVAGGLVAVAIYALALAPLAPRAGYAGDFSAAAAVAWVALALGVTALSVEGDLVESLLKRGAGVKDSGRLLPGHGGVLDRIDALLSSMPAVALLAEGFLR